MLKRDRSRTSARLLMPSPAPLPNLREALARRAEVFGPFDLDEPPEVRRGAWQAFGAVVRRVADILRPARVAA